MPKPISVQLYSLRESAKNDFAGVLSSLADIGYPYVEFAGLHGKSAREVRKIIDGVGLKASSAHGPIFDPSKREQVAEEAETLGYKHLVSGFGAKDFESVDTVKAIAEKANEAINYFGPLGFTVNLHNHEWEFQQYEKFNLLLELAPKLCPQLDVYWVKVGGENPAEVIRRYGRRTNLLHIKDGPADATNRALPMTAVGKGSVDISSCVLASEGTAVEFMVVELDNCATDMLQAVKESYNFLTQRSLAAGTR